MRLKLEDHCTFINGGSWTAVEYSDTGHPVLKVSNFDKDSISYNELSFLQKSSFEKYLKNQLAIHDIVIATVGSHPSLVNSAAGRCITIPKVAIGFLLNQNAVCVRTKDREIIDQRYLGYLCKSQLFQHFIQQRGKGAANQMRIPISGIKGFEFDFPEINTQRKIAAILSAYDDLIENNLKRIKLMEEKALLTYEEWFVRMKFPGHENTPVDKETGLPEGWEKGKVADLFELQRGFDLPVQNREEGSIPILASTGIVDYHNIGKVQGPGIVTGRSGTIGEVQFVANDFWPLNTTLWIKSYKRANPAFALQFLRTINLKRFAGGSAVPSLDRKVVHHQSIRVPAIKLIQEYEALCNPILSNIKNLQNQNQLLKEARDILLPRLMTGMIEPDKISGQVVDGLIKEPIIGSTLNVAAEPEVAYGK